MMRYLLALLSAAAWMGLGLSGGSDPTCTVDPSSRDEPTPALECSSGRLCYRGACLTGCSPGQEGTETCGGDGDCSGPRGRCVDGFCSACEPGEQCVPALGVCQVISDIPLPPVPDLPDPNRPRPPQPRDGGVLDPGLERQPDAGANPDPVVRPVTHAAFIDIFRTEIITGQGESGDQVRIVSLDVEGNPGDVIWRLDVEPPALEVGIQADGDCDLNRLDVPTSSPTPESIGDILIDDFEGSGALLGSDGEPPQGLDATWDEEARRYEIAPAPLPEPLLRLSNLDTLESTFLAVTGAGRSGLTAGTWPNPEVSHHVPFTLTPEEATRLLLEEVQVVGQEPSRDLTFRWARVGTGVIPTEGIAVRIPGVRHEISCFQREGPGTPGAITLTAGLLERFRGLEELSPGAQYPLILERASAQQLQVNPDPDVPNIRIFLSVRVRHSLEGRIEF